VEVVVVCEKIELTSIWIINNDKILNIFLFSSYMKPIVKATVCYLFHKGKLLVIDRNANKPDDPMQGYISVPGGKIDGNETPEQCVIREFLDETGLTLIKPKLRGEVLFVNPENNKDWLVYMYTCDDFTGDYDPDHREGTIKWAEQKGWEELKWRPGDKVYIPCLFGNNYFIGRVEQTKDKILSQEIHFK
jgi:8-oxo-dGTP diphosphatase